MKRQSSFLLVFCVVSGSLAKPPPTFLEYKDSLGQYSFGYSAPGSARSEVRSIDGSTRGSYSYVDGLGHIQSAQYTADGENGFQIIATNLPQAPRPVEETPEVTAARIDHFKALEAASKLSEETSKNDGQRSAIDAGKSEDSVVINSDMKIEDKMEIQAAAKSVKSPEAVASSGSVETPRAESNEANEMEIPAQMRSVEIPEAAMASIPVETQAVESNEGNEAAGKSAAVGNEDETMQILEKSSQDESSKQSIQPQVKSAEVSSPSDVPVVTTSFVIPGSLNLHTRIQLQQSDGVAARIVPESSSLLFAQQPSISQGVNAYASTLTPAGTRMMEMTENESTKSLGGVSSLSAAPVAKSMPSANKPQEYSNAIVSGAIVPTSTYAFAYGIGVDPIYYQYNPYRYFPYGIL